MRTMTGNPELGGYRPLTYEELEYLMDRSSVDESSVFVTKVPDLLDEAQERMGGFGNPLPGSIWGFRIGSFGVPVGHLGKAAKSKARGMYVACKLMGISFEVLT